jgi:hypothetical protein
MLDCKYHFLKKGITFFGHFRTLKRFLSNVAYIYIYIHTWTNNFLFFGIVGGEQTYFNINLWIVLQNFQWHYQAENNENRDPVAGKWGEP